MQRTTRQADQRGQSPDRADSTLFKPYLLDGVVLSRDLVAAGWSREALRRLVRAGELQPLMRGAYRAPGRIEPLTHHLLMARAACQLSPSPVVASHVTALALAGLPVQSRDLETVHLTSLGRNRGRRVGPVLRHAAVPGLIVHPVEPRAVPRASIADALIQAGCHRPWPELLIYGDAALHAGLVTPGELAVTLLRFAHYPHIGQVRAMVKLFDARHESPGETRLATVLRQLGWASTPQVELAAEGRRYRVDRLLDSFPVVIEFDGRLKYDGAQGSRALFEEKVREDALRGCGHEFVRITWRQLERPEEVHRLILAAVARSVRTAAWHAQRDFDRPAAR